MSRKKRRQERMCVRMLLRLLWDLMEGRSEAGIRELLEL